MASSARSLTSLLKQTAIEDHAEVLAAADAALKQAKGDLEAQHIRVVALLKLDRYADAVKAVESGGQKLKDRAALEYAYALYKDGKPSAAADVAQAGGSERGFRHVQAQARYRTEEFATAAELYQALASTLEDDAEADLRINAGAVDAQLEWAGRGDLVGKKKPAREDFEAFESAFNAACGSIARGELGQGEVLLKRARDLCNALDELTEDDKQAELLPITIQQVYVLARLGKLGEAEKLAATIEVKRIPDPSTRQIAQVNVVAAAGKSSNPFLTQRLVAKDLDSLKPDYPFHFQSSIIRRDRYAADLQSLKFEGTAESTASLIAKQASPNLDPFTNGLSAVNGAAHAKGQTGKEALKIILSLLDKRPNDVGLILTIIQLYVLTGNPDSATRLLESFFNRLEQSGNSADLDVRFAPGLVGTKVGLHASQGQRSAEQHELAKAATHWRRKPKEWPVGVANLLKAAGTALLEPTRPQDAKLANEIFVDLQKQDSKDRYAFAGVLATSSDPAIASQTKELTSIDRLIAGIDAEKLENNGIPQLPTAAGAASRKRPAEETKPKKAKKIRQSRMPKDYDPNKKPDLERWLPLRDRSTYRPKGKKGKARANLLSQGAAPTGDSDGSRPGTPGGEVIKQKQQQGGGGGGKKKKGKGNKW